MTAVGSKGRTQGVVCSGCAWWVQTSNTLFSAYSSCLHLNRGTTNKSKMPNQLPASMTPSYTIQTCFCLRKAFFLPAAFPACTGFHPPSLPAQEGVCWPQPCWRVAKSAAWLWEAGRLCTVHLGCLPPAPYRLTGLSLLAFSNSS